MNQSAIENENQDLIELKTSKTGTRCIKTTQMYNRDVRILFNLNQTVVFDSYTSPHRAFEEFEELYIIRSCSLIHNIH